MPSLFRHLFRKNGGGSLPEPAISEDLERGHEVPGLQTSTARGYQSSPSRLYLLGTQSILAPIVHQTSTPSREYFSNMKYNDQHGLVVQAPLTPAGPSRVIGYLPRTICNGSASIVEPTKMRIMPSQRSQNASNGGGVGNSGPQRHLTSISSAVSSRCPSPRFNHDKHGLALQRLESLGPLRIVPSSHQEDCSKIASLPEGPKIESDQTFRESVLSPVYPLPNMEANRSSQTSQQALYLSQFLPKPHKAVPSELNCLDMIAADVWPDTLSKNPCLGGTSENDKLNRRVPVFGSGTQGDKQHENMSIHGVEEKKEQKKIIKDPDRERTHQDYSVVQSPVFEEIDEYTWSPAPSDDGQEPLPAPPTPGLHHVPFNVLRTPPPSELASDSHSGLLHSIPYSNEYTYTQKLSDNPGGVDRLLPHINILVPAGSIDLGSHLDFLSSSQHASMIGSRESSSMLFRYSGIIKDDSSSRPMSKTELEEAALRSREDRMKTDLSMLDWRDSSIQLDHDTKSEQIRRAHKPNARPEALPLDRVRDLSADAGPGSSQTSSLLSADRYIGDLSGHKEPSVFPTSRVRCPTPPLLFGKKAICEAERSENASKSALRGTISRFDRILRANRLEKTGSLPAAICSLGEQDWETVSAETEAHTYAVDGIASNTKIGSSLADNSDSGTLSFSKEKLSPFHSVRACPVLQHPAHPRHNYSFMLLKNSQTGDFVQVPQYDDTSSGYLPNKNARSQLVLGTRAGRTYQHPSPLRVEHNHPLMSLPPIIRFNQPSLIGAESIPVMVRQDHPNPQSSSSGLSESVKEGRVNQTNIPFCKMARDISRVPTDVSRVFNSAVNQDQQMIQSKEQSHHSSAWLSTVGEAVSSEPSLPGNGDPLLRTIGRDRKAHVNGTPDRTGNREVGSSLADTSSPGPNFSSSPAPLASSIIQFSDTPPFSVQNYRKRAIPPEWEVGSQHMLADSHKSFARSFSSEYSAISISNTSHHSRSFSAGGPQPQHREPLPRRRSSSRESYSGLMDSPFAPKASALNLSSSDSRGQQVSSSGLPSRNRFVQSDENNTGCNPSQPNVIERRGRQSKADDSSTDDPTTTSLTDSRPFMRNEALDNDFAPQILLDPVDGRARPWDRLMPGCPRPRLHPNPLGGPLFQRPVARVESPHLHRIPHAPTPELLERHILLSRVYLILSMVIPPIALVYGHGYLDGLLRLHTEGRINSFRNTEKSIALCWGYGLSAICVFTIVIAMIVTSASA